METVIKKTTRQDQKIATESLFNLSKAATTPEAKSNVVEIKIQGSEEVITVPRKAFDLFFKILASMSEGMSVSLISSDSEISTQQAADMLHVSRPHIVKLLEQGTIPFRKVGSHRRILLEDLIRYEAKLKGQRNKSLKFLAKQAQDLNLGYE